MEQRNETVKRNSSQQKQTPRYSRSWTQQARTLSSYDNCF